MVSPVHERRIADERQLRRGAQSLSRNFAVSSDCSDGIIQEDGFGFRRILVPPKLPDPFCVERPGEHTAILLCRASF